MLQSKPRSLEPHTLTLPNSYSTRYFQIVSGSDPPWIAPEIAVEPTLADLRAGRDPLPEMATAPRPPG